MYTNIKSTTSQLHKLTLSVFPSLCFDWTLREKQHVLSESRCNAIKPDDCHARSQDWAEKMIHSVSALCLHKICINLILCICPAPISNL